MSRIVCVGPAAVNIVLTGLNQWPDGPGSVATAEQWAWHTGGAAINTGLDILNMTHNPDVVEIVCRVGDDPFGNFLCEQWRKAHGSSNGPLVTNHAATDLRVVRLHREAHNDRSIIVVGTGSCEVTPDDLDRRIQSLGRVDFLFITGLGQLRAFEEPTIVPILKGIRANGTMICVDALCDEKVKPEEWQRRLGHVLRQTDYLLASSHETSLISGLPVDQLSAQADWFQDVLHVKNVCIKIGDGGAYVHQEQETVPAFIVPQPVSRLGAGDAWCAGFLVGLCKDFDVRRCAILGNAASSFSLRGAGPSDTVPNWEEILKLARTNDDFEERKS